MYFHGELAHGGRVVLERVDGNIRGQPQADGSTAWSGAFFLPAGHQPLGDGEYTLILDDGASHVIRLGSVDSSPCLPAIVLFKVNGSMDEPPQPAQYFRL
ncbi:MAG TPA: hypothetical protein VM597_15050 [Gemmataceae bacterium]|jgi:hypothetical protein|nr:hypothetical protein [Gemmataceae bacterium]